MNESDTNEHTILRLVVPNKLFMRLSLLNEIMSEMKPIERDHDRFYIFTVNEEMSSLTVHVCSSVSFRTVNKMGHVIFRICSDLLR